MKCLYIYNALSGSNKEKRNHNIIINRLKKIYSSLECFEITKEKNEIDKILEYNFDDIIISGGDGSFSLFIKNSSLHMSSLICAIRVRSRKELPV